MHLLCRSTSCPGNELPAGSVDDESCRFCGDRLADSRGNVLAQGAAPLVDGEPPASFNALMDALRDAGHEVKLVELTAVRVGDSLLVSALTPAGEVVGAEVCDGERAEEVERVMGLLNVDDG